MKKNLDCYAQIYQSQKQSSNNKKYELHYNMNISRDQKRRNVSKNKSKADSHCRINTMTTSIFNKEISPFMKNTSSEKRINLQKKYSSMLSSDNSQLLISAYEQAIISLFSLLKESTDEAHYKSLKEKFFAELEQKITQGNIKEIKSNNKTSTLSSSNSIISLLQESKNKICINQRNNYSKYRNNNGFLSHKSLYTLSKPGKTVNSNSPEKQSINDKSFLMKFYSFNKNLNSSKSKSKVYMKTNIKNKQKKNKENFVNKTLGNFSGTNIIKQLDMQNKNTTEGNSNKEDKKNQSHNSELLLKIKSSLDDNLKGFFDFSYESFLNKNSERDNTMRTYDEHEHK